MSAQEVVTADDVKRMDLDELKRTNRDFDIDVDELEFPPFAHHMTVRGKLEALVEREIIDYDQMASLYEQWKENKQ